MYLLNHFVLMCFYLNIILINYMIISDKHYCWLLIVKENIPFEVYQPVEGSYVTLTMFCAWYYFPLHI